MNFKEIVNDIGSKAKKASIKLRTLNADKKKIAYEYLEENIKNKAKDIFCLLYTSPSPRDQRGSRMPGYG